MPSAAGDKGRPPWGPPGRMGTRDPPRGQKDTPGDKGTPLGTKGHHWRQGNPPLGTQGQEPPPPGRHLPGDKGHPWGGGITATPPSPRGCTPWVAVTPVTVTVTPGSVPGRILRPAPTHRLRAINGTGTACHLPGHPVPKVSPKRRGRGREIHSTKGQRGQWGRALGGGVGDTGDLPHTGILGTLGTTPHGDVGDIGDMGTCPTWGPWRHWGH